MDENELDDNYYFVGNKIGKGDSKTNLNDNLEREDDRKLDGANDTDTDEREYDDYVAVNRGYVSVKKEKKGNKIENNSSLAGKESANKRLKELREGIIKKIKKDFEKKIAEVEVLESEIYRLNEENSEELDLEKVKEIKEKINEIIKKINEIIDQRNIYGSNYELDDTIFLDDTLIVDDIIEYKSLVDSYKENNQIVNDYKLLDEYITLYDKLEEATVIINDLMDENREKIEDFEQRDYDYSKTLGSTDKVVELIKEHDLEIDRYGDYFEELMKKINEIDVSQRVNYRLVGLDELLGSGIRYLALIMVSPLAGLIPSIAIDTLATRRMLINIYRGLHYEEFNEILYEAYDYESEINNKLTDLDYTYDMVEDTIGFVDRIKSDFMKQYNSAIPGYEDTLKKINDIEKKVKKNRHQLDFMKNNLIQSKKINSDKMIKVRELNQRSNRDTM